MVVTFFIDSNPCVTAQYLDSRRLGKQRVEAKQIITVLEAGELGKGWKNHPATQAWKDYIPALKDYYNAMIDEWITRGYNNTMEKFPHQKDVIYPEWCSNTRIHYSHMARLIQKDPDFYNPRFNPPKEYHNFGYIWPSKWNIKELEILPLDKLAEPFKFEMKCQGVKKDGKKCVNKALKSSNYCGVHKKQG
jgi:hypothetical protein